MKQIINAWLLFILVLWIVILIRWNDTLEINIDTYYFILAYPYAGLLITLTGLFIIGAYVLIVNIIGKKYNKQVR